MSKTRRQFRPQAFKVREKCRSRDSDALEFFPDVYGCVLLDLDRTQKTKLRQIHGTEQLLKTFSSPSVYGEPTLLCLQAHMNIHGLNSHRKFKILNVFLARSDFLISCKLA